MKQTIKPNKQSFYYFSLFTTLIIATIIFGGFAIAASFVHILFVPIVFVLYLLFVGLQWLSIHKHYQKTTYEINDGNIIIRTGGIFSQNESQLQLKNATHIKYTLPFLKQKLFQTGNITIESAGSSSGTIYLSDIENTEKTFNTILANIQAQGFSLTQKKIVQQEQPSSTGIFVDMFTSIVRSIIFFIIFIPTIIVGAIASLAQIIAIPLAVIVGILLALCALIITALFVLFRYLDLRMRTYTVYNDTITYNEGFLTKHYSVIPYENIADANIQAPLMLRIFGIANVVVSSQGSGKEVTFLYMRNADTLEKNIDNLVKEAKNKKPQEKKQTATIKKTTVKKEAKKIPTSNQTGSYKMDSMRTIFPGIFIGILIMIIFGGIFIFSPAAASGLLIFLIVALVLLVKPIFTLIATTYQMKENSIVQTYDFISKKKVEFTNNKIVAIKITESIIDTLFQTYSIHFWSIGTSESIVFKNIKRTTKLHELLCDTFGFTQNNKLLSIKPKVTIGAYIAKHIFVWIVLLIGFIITVAIPFFIPIIIGLVIVIALSLFFTKMRYRTASVTIYQDYLMTQKGWLFKEIVYANHENNKSVRATAYPGSHTGTLRIDVAGEHIEQRGNGRSQQTVIVSNNITMPYITKVFDAAQTLDYITATQPTAFDANETQTYNAQKRYATYKPMPHNSMLFAIPFCIFIITIPVAIIQYIKVRKTTYYVEENRITKTYGIFYKGLYMLQYRKIDSINTGQGAVNKMFDNGYILISTAGSSGIELTIAAIKEFKDCYTEIRRQYEEEK